MGVLTAGQLISAPATAAWRQYRGERVIVAEVRNRGRAEVNVDSLMFRYARTAATSEARPENPSLPHRLLPGSTAQFVVSVLPLIEQIRVARELGVKTDAVRAEAGLGTGRTVKSKHGVKIPG